MDEHNRSADLIGHFPLGSLGDVVPDNVRATILLGDVVLIEVGDGVPVVEAKEGALRRNKVRVESLDDLGRDGVRE
jgi:hypothetical protein